MLVRKSDKTFSERLLCTGTYPSIAVFTLCEAVVYWKQKRTWSILLIAGAVISMACFVLEGMLL
jgi:hypothetical protein